MSLVESRRGALAPAARLLPLVDVRRMPAAVIVYLALAGVVCFWRLGSVGLISMEGMVVDGARAMLETGERLVPRVYGEIYTYKPALAYWVAALPLSLGVEDAEALLRLPFAGAALLMGLGVLLLVARVAGSRAGLLAALASVSGGLCFEKTRVVEFDMLLAAAVGLAVTAAVSNLAAARPRWGIWALGYAALGAGFLAKGLPALMAYGPGLLAAGLATRRFRSLFGWRHLSAALLFVAIAGGYLSAVYSAAGAEAFRQPLLEARVRGLDWSNGSEVMPHAERNGFEPPRGGSGPEVLSRAARSLAKPLVIFGAFLPWSVLLLFAPLGREAAGAGPLRRLALAAAGFLAAGTLAFMAVPTHETRYYLPLCVPVGILAGVTAESFLRRPADRRARNAALAGAVLAGSMAVGTALSGALLLPTPPVPPGGRLAMVLAGAGGVAVLYVVRRRPAGERVVAAFLAAALCLMAAQYLGFQIRRADKRIQRGEAAALLHGLPGDGPVWMLGTTDEVGKHASLVYYLRRPVRSFLPGRWPPAGEHPCLLTAQGLEELGGSARLAFRELARAEHVWWSYRAGVCSVGQEPAGPVGR